MDGTALYQAVATVFIAQSLGMHLGLAAQVTIILTAVMASIGTPTVPGAGIIMPVIILDAIGVPSRHRPLRWCSPRQGWVSPKRRQRSDNRLRQVGVFGSSALSDPLESSGKRGPVY